MATERPEGRHLKCALILCSAALTHTKSYYNMKAFSLHWMWGLVWDDGVPWKAQTGSSSFNWMDDDPKTAFGLQLRYDNKKEEKKYSKIVKKKFQKMIITGSSEDEKEMERWTTNLWKCVCESVCVCVCVWAGEVRQIRVKVGQQAQQEPRREPSEIDTKHW